MATGSGEKIRSSHFGEQDPVSSHLSGPDKLYLFDKTVTFSNVGSVVEFASTPLLALPRGDLIVVGGYLHLDAIKVGADILAAFVLSYGLGTVAQADNDLVDAGDVDLKTLTTLAAATAGVSPHSKGGLNGANVLASGGATNYLDNNAGTLAVFLNMTLPDASVTGPLSSLRVKGSLRLVTIGLGKNA
jgi:hypothetical protein